MSKFLNKHSKLICIVLAGFAVGFAMNSFRIMNEAMNKPVELNKISVKQGEITTLKSNFDSVDKTEVEISTEKNPRNIAIAHGKELFQFTIPENFLDYYFDSNINCLKFSYEGYNFTVGLSDLANVNERISFKDVKVGGMEAISAVANLNCNTSVEVLATRVDDATKLEPKAFIETFLQSVKEVKNNYVATIQDSVVIVCSDDTTLSDSSAVIRDGKDELIVTLDENEFSNKVFKNELKTDSGITFYHKEGMEIDGFKTYAMDLDGQVVRCTTNNPVMLEYVKNINVSNE